MSDSSQTTPAPTDSSLLSPPTRRQPLRLGNLGRGVLFRFGLFATLAVTIMMAAIIYAMWRQVNDVRKQQQSMATWTANTVDQWFSGLLSEVGSAAQDTKALDGSTQEVDAYLSSVLLRNPAFASATLLDVRSGRPRERGTAAAGRVTAMLYASEWLTGTLLQGYGVTSMHSVQGMPMVVLSYASRQGGQNLGILAVLVDLSQGYSILRPAHTDDGSYAYVVDADGRTVLHEYTTFQFSRQLHPEVAGIAAALEGQVNLPVPYQGLNREGSQVIGAWARLQQVPWTVIAEQPIAPVVRGLLPLAIGALVIFGLSLAGSLVVGLFISRRVVQPIMQLQEGARRVGTGDLEHPISLPGRSELADLAGEFNAMAENLRESQVRQEAWGHELEDRVKARTTELSQAMEQLQEEMRTRENLLLMLKEMASPVIPIMAGIIVVPIVGTLDSQRAQRVMDDVLAGVEREHARVVILDITGLAMVDTAVANALLQASRAAQLLGAQPILVGIAAEVAETLVHLGVELRQLHTAATLQEGLQTALAILRRKVVAL